MPVALLQVTRDANKLEPITADAADIARQVQDALRDRLTDISQTFAIEELGEADGTWSKVARLLYTVRIHMDREERGGGAWRRQTLTRSPACLSPERGAQVRHVCLGDDETF